LGVSRLKSLNDWIVNEKKLAAACKSAHVSFS
jgi:hypothetical protein